MGSGLSSEQFAAEPKGEMLGPHSDEQAGERGVVVRFP